MGNNSKNSQLLYQMIIISLSYAGDFEYIFRPSVNQHVA